MSSAEIRVVNRGLHPIAYDLVDANREQLSLLDTPEREAQRERDHKLMAALDALNEKMGKGTVRLGVPRENAAWHLRCAAVDDAVARVEEGESLKSTVPGLPRAPCGKVMTLASHPGGGLRRNCQRSLT